MHVCQLVRIIVTEQCFEISRSNRSFFSEKLLFLDLKKLIYKGFKISKPDVKSQKL